MMILKVMGRVVHYFTYCILAGVSGEKLHFWTPRYRLQQGIVDGVRIKAY